eukprot:6269501-Amphidinium_carterae.1
MRPQDRGFIDLKPKFPWFKKHFWLNAGNLPSFHKVPNQPALANKLVDICIQSRQQDSLSSP